MSANKLHIEKRGKKVSVVVNLLIKNHYVHVVYQSIMESLIFKN